MCVSYIVDCRLRFRHFRIKSGKLKHLVLAKHLLANGACSVCMFAEDPLRHLKSYN